MKNNGWIRGGIEYRKHLYIQYFDRLERLRHEILSRKIQLLANLLVKDANNSVVFYESFRFNSVWFQDGIEEFVQQFERDVEDVEDGIFAGDFYDSVIDELQQKVGEMVTKFREKELRELVHDDDWFVHDEYDEYDDYDERVHGAIRLKWEIEVKDDEGRRRRKTTKTNEEDVM